MPQWRFSARLFGDLLSVRLPRRIVPSCVSEPTGTEWPRRTNSTPAMNVVATAPIPGVKVSEAETWVELPGKRQIRIYDVEPDGPFAAVPDGAATKG